MNLAAQSVLWIGIAGILTSTGYLLMLLWGVWRFRRRHACPPQTADSQLPAVTMMKPLYGLEPGLEKNLETFFLQDYPQFEILFGTRDASDPALEVVRRLCQRHPKVNVRIVYSGEPTRANAKVCTLEEMFRYTVHEYIVISDSDVSVGREYLRRLIPPLCGGRTGLVMCLYRGVPTGGLWSSLEALGMSVEMTGGVLAASMMGEVDFALGPTMATTRTAVDAAGGIAQLADYCADDYVLGNRIQQAGYKVEFSSEIINHYVVNRSFAASVRHNLRWMKSTLHSIPGGHMSSVLGYAMPFGLLAALGGTLGGHAVLGMELLAWTLLNRLLMCAAVGWGVVGDRRALTHCWLYPLRDLMGFLFWVGSYMGSTVEWRGERYKLLKGGRMQRW